MASKATVNLPNLDRVRIGNTAISRIMKGSDQIWPQFPFYLKSGSDYYKVTGINNNQYTKLRIVTSAECPLVYFKGISYNTGIALQPWCSFEICLTSFQGSIFYHEDGKSSKDSGDAQCYQDYNTDYQKIQFNYMAASSNGSGLNSQYISDSSYISQKTTVTPAYVLEAISNKTSSNSGNKQLKLRKQDSTSYLLQATQITAYTPSTSWYNNKHFILFSRNTRQSFYDSVTDYCYFYYMKIFDADKNIIGFYHAKKNGSNYEMYDEITKSYCSVYKKNTTISRSYQNKSLTITAAAPTSYYTVSGTITENGKTYERLVNNLDNTKIIRGIQK